MEKIVEAEQFKVQDGALDIIASAADGGMRDALSCSIRLYHSAEMS